MKRVALGMIRFYQQALSPLTPPSCRYQPTCSNYGYEAIQRFGVLRGSWMAAARIARCHPFAAGGYDPVPDKATKNGEPGTRGHRDMSATAQGSGPASLRASDR
jgi:hypothetical protein